MTSKLSYLKSKTKKLMMRHVPPEIIPLMKHYRSKMGKYLAKNVSVTSILPKDSVLIIAPHHDDEIIGTGGVLGMYLENQSQITVLYMTDGRLLNLKRGLSAIDTLNLRRKEAESIGMQYHIQQLFWEVKDGCLTNDDSTVSAMINIIKDIRPNIIYCPSFFDYHFDHFSACLILSEALKKSLPILSVCMYEIMDHIPYPNLYHRYFQVL